MGDVRLTPAQQEAINKRIAELEAENERLKQQALADDLAMEAAAERDNDQIKRLREAIQKWYDYGYDRGEAEKMLEGE
jgi:hypothetical protein